MNITAKNIEISYSSTDGPVLRDISLRVHQGEFLSIMGRSGSGKTTLLNALAGITSPSSGQVLYGDDDLWGLNDRDRSTIRSERTATVFQDFNLFDFLTVSENIRLAGRISGTRVSAEQVSSSLRAVELDGMERRYPGDLSGGQRQRVAIARALAVEPEVIFADEPTGSLDEKSGDVVMKLLRSVTESGVSVIMVTHDPTCAAATDRVCMLREGVVDRVLETPTASDVTDAVFSRVQGEPGPKGGV